MLFYLFLSLFIFTSNSTLSAATTAEAYYKIPYAHTAEDNTVIQNCRLTIKDYSAHVTATQNIYFSSLRSAVKALLFNLKCESLTVEDCIALFERYAYPGQEYLKLNPEKLAELIASKELNKLQHDEIKFNLIMRYCIDDTRSYSIDDTALSLDHSSNSSRSTERSPDVSPEPTPGISPEELSLMGNPSPTPPKSPSRLRVTRDPHYWNPLPISQK